MGRKSLSEIRTQEIIEAFYSVAIEIGLENASIGKIAKKLDVSRGLILHYFDSKEKLLLALNDYILDKYLQFINADEFNNITSKADLEHFIKSLFSREWANYIDDGVFYSFYALIYRHQIIRENLKSFLNTLRNHLKSILQACKNKNIIINEDITQLSDLLFALIDGAYFKLGAYIDNNDEYNLQAKPYITHAISLLEFK